MPHRLSSNPVEREFANLKSRPRKRRELVKVSAWDSIEQLEKYKLYQSSCLPKLGTDSKLLAQFATLHRRERVCDLGCGVGTLGVLLAQRQEGLILDGVEIVPESAELAAFNLECNGLLGSIYQGDLRNYRQWAPRPGGYDLVISNPPYFAPNTGKTAEGVRKTARSEECCTLQDLCVAAGWLLHTGGRFALCYRAERLTALFSALEHSGIQPKRLQLVQHSPAHPPKIVLVEGIRMGRPGLKILPTLFVDTFNAQWRKEFFNETAL